MAFCMNCGKQLPDGAKFCLECGTKLGEIKENQTSKRETTYGGTIYKCPNCGDILNSFTTNCPACGYEIRSIKTSSPVEMLAKKVEQATTLDEKIEYIANFYVPNTKEDVVEFLIYASSNLCLNGASIKSAAEIAMNNAWLVKFEQAYQKMCILSQEDQSLENLLKKYGQIYKAAKRNSARQMSYSEVTKTYIFVAVILLGLMVFVGLLSSFAFGH